MPYDRSPMKKSSCIKMYDGKGKQTGLMMEGSVAHMESVAHHAGKSKLHAKPGKDYPDDGHLHYQGGKKVESPGVSETKKLSDTSGAVGQMSPYKFTGMSGGSAMYNTDPEDGVTVTGDASKIGGKTTMTETEKKREELKKRIEQRKIRHAQEKMERKMKTETIKAEIGKRRIAREQEKRKREGKDYIDPATGKVVRRS